MDEKFASTIMTIEKKTYKNMIIDYLKKQLFNGRYIEGDRINESQLSKMFNISKGPVHQAILQLEDEGLLHCEKNFGCKVKVLRGKETWGYFLLRAELEEMALNFYDEGPYDTLIEKLNVIIEEMDTAANNKDLYKLIRLDSKFHEMMVSYPKKKQLFNCWEILNHSIDSIYLTLLYTGICSFYDLPMFNRHLISFIESGSVANLCTVVNSHYIETGMKLLELC